MREQTDSKVVGKGGECECGSSDARFKYDDGHYYCFSCATFTPPPLKEDMTQSIREALEEEQVKDSSPSVYTHEYVALRGIGKATMRKYKTVCSIDDEGVPVHMRFPYGNLTIVKKLSDKSFHTEGDPKEVKLFGEDLFNSGEAQSITICEGAEDAMSVYEMLGSKYPAVSVRSAIHARRDCERRFEYIDSFSKIYLCFDNDAPGQKALKDVASLFDVNKVYHVKLDKYKDANDYHVNNAQDAFVRVWWNSRTFMPATIVGQWDSLLDVLSKKQTTSICAYPFSTLQTKTHGLRTGEVTLLTGLEGRGKSEILREIEYHILKETDLNIGMVHLEESYGRSIQGLVGKHLKSPIHLPGYEVSAEEQVEAYKTVTKRDNRAFIYSHFGADDDAVIIDTLRYMAAVLKCKVISLDHITMLATSNEQDDERRRLDYLSTRFATLCRDLDFSLLLVSHVNDDGLTRGSRNISKVADTWIHLDRDITHDDIEVRNRTNIIIKKNRFSGQTGPSGSLLFDPSTYTLNEEFNADVF